MPEAAGPSRGPSLAMAGQAAGDALASAPTMSLAEPRSSIVQVHEQAGAEAGWPITAGRSVAHAGLSLMLGGAALGGWLPGLPRRTAANAILLGALLHLVGTVAMLALPARAPGQSIASFLAMDEGQDLYARALLGAAAVVVMVPAFLSTRTRLLAPAAATALVAAAAILAARTSHAASAGLAGAALDTMHLAAAAIWVGGLALLAWCAWRGRFDPAVPVAVVARRFGTIALGCVVVLATTGVLAALQVSPYLLVEPSDPWARVLAAKVVLTGAMLVVAGLNRFVVLAPAARGWRLALQARLRAPALAPGDQRPLSFARMVAVEAAVGLVVLALAAVLVSLPPVA